MSKKNLFLPESPLAWGRGLKLEWYDKDHEANFVAPRVGAWIETDVKKYCDGLEKSPLAWGRGLKHLAYVILSYASSRPSRGGVD